DAAAPRHRQVHEDDVWSRGLGQRHGFTAGASLADDYEIGLLLEQRAQACPHDRVIVRENHLDEPPPGGGARPEHRDNLPPDPLSAQVACSVPSRKSCAAATPVTCPNEFSAFE